MAICRERLLPPVLAWVWDRTLTPVWCTMITGLICGVPATSQPLLAVRPSSDRHLPPALMCSRFQAALQYERSTTLERNTLELDLNLLSDCSADPMSLVSPSAARAIGLLLCLPEHADLHSGGCTAIIALLTDFVTLADLVSLGTLAVFLLVACALVYRR